MEQSKSDSGKSSIGQFVCRQNLYNTFNSKINGVCIGSEMAGGVRNVYMAVFEGYPIRNIRLHNVTIDSTPVSYCLKNAENIIFEKVIINEKQLETNPKPSEIIKVKVM